MSDAADSLEVNDTNGNDDLSSASATARRTDDLSTHTTHQDTLQPTGGNAVTVDTDVTVHNKIDNLSKHNQLLRGISEMLPKVIQKLRQKQRTTAVDVQQQTQRRPSEQRLVVNEIESLCRSLILDGGLLELANGDRPDSTKWLMVLEAFLANCDKQSNGQHQQKSFPRSAVFTGDINKESATTGTPDLKLENATSSAPQEISLQRLIQQKQTSRAVARASMPQKRILKATAFAGSLTTFSGSGRMRTTVMAEERDGRRHHGMAKIEKEMILEETTKWQQEEYQRAIDKFYLDNPTDAVWLEVLDENGQVTNWTAPPMPMKQRIDMYERAFVCAEEEKKAIKEKTIAAVKAAMRQSDRNDTGDRKGHLKKLRQRESVLEDRMDQDYEELITLKASIRAWQGTAAANDTTTGDTNYDHDDTTNPLDNDATGQTAKCGVMRRLRESNNRSAVNETLKKQKSDFVTDFFFDLLAGENATTDDVQQP